MKIKSGHFDKAVKFVGERCTWYRPITVEQLLSLKQKHPRSKLVSGNTELGVEANVKGSFYETLICVSDIRELNEIHVDEKGTWFVKWKTL